MTDYKQDLISTQEIPIMCEGGNPVSEDGYCDVAGCQSCCQHDERDHGCCLDCGEEEDFGAAIDAAQDSLEDR